MASLIDIFRKAVDLFVHLGQVLGVAKFATSPSIIRAGLFILGFALIHFGINSRSVAEGGVYNDTRIEDSVNLLMTYLEGSFGGLIMVCSGIGAILSAAFGQYRAALGCLVVAVGAFILRSFISTFFNVEIISD